MRNLSVIKGMYQGNGVTRRFAIPFEYNDTAQIFVTVTTYDDGDYTYRVLDRTEFTIDEDSVEIVYPKSADDTPISNSQYLTVWRDTDLLQLLDLTNQGAAWPDSIEEGLDKLHQIVQELAEGLSRALKVDIGDPQTPDEKLIAIQDYVLAAAESSRSASASEASAQRSAEAAATSEANAAESERLAGGYADTATDAASRAEDSAISARAYNAPDYDNETTYQAGDVVTYTDGNSYRALQETTGNEPPNIIYWQKVTDYVGDDFFEVDEYGYIVPMDSPSHSRYWRVDQDGYIVPIEGGDGGYRPDTRSLSAEYLNVTNEGYIKHLRADDVNAGNLSATGNVTAGMVTTPQANVTTLTANAVNAGTVNAQSASVGTLTADDVIAKGPIVDVRAFGAKGDGVAHIVDSVDTELMALNNAATTAYNSNKILYIPKGTYNISDSWVIDKNIQVYCEGKIYFTGGAKPCVVLDSLDGCNGANIYIDTIESQWTSFVYDATNINTNIGILVKNTKHCDIKINHIESFIVAVKMFAENAGTYYNKINLKYAKGCYFVYDLLTHSDTSKNSAFCNANMFYDTVWLYNANWSNSQLPYFVKNKVIYDGEEAEYPPHIDNTNYFINLMVEYAGTSNTYPRLINLTQCRDFHINFKRIEINTGGSTHIQGEITNAIIGDGYTSECEINIEFSWNTIAINFAGDSNRIYTQGSSIKRIKVSVTFTAAANSYGLIRLPIDPSYKITQERIVSVVTSPWQYSNMKGLQITNGVFVTSDNELALSYYTPVEASSQNIDFIIWYV